MNSYDAWNKALKQTEIIRPRVQALRTFEDTPLPYILLSESSINAGDTVVRTGEVMVQKPALILPPNVPQFFGFDFEKMGEAGEDSFVNFLMVRGIQLPSFKYNNRTVAMDIFEGKLSQAIKHYREQLQSMENVHAGLVAGPEDCWPFSLLMYVCSQIVRNAEVDIRRLLEDYHKKNRLS